MSDVIATAERLKREAQRARKSEDIDGALRLAEEAIGALEREYAGLGDEARSGTYGVQVAAAIADAYGTKGGILRTAGRYRESAAAYDAGYEHEHRVQHTFPSSYNSVQRLVARILDHPERLAEDRWRDDVVSYPETFEEAEGELKQQLAGSRINDPWAMADRGLLLLLLGGDPASERTAWREIQRVKPPAYVFSSTLPAIRDIQTKLDTVPETVRDAPRLADLHSRIAWVLSFLEKASKTA